MSEEEKLAEEHAEWTSKFFKWVYKEAFLHGYKHGKKEVIKNGEENKVK